MLDLLSNFMFFILGLLVAMLIKHLESLLKIKRDKNINKDSNEIEAFEKLLESHHNFLKAFNIESRLPNNEELSKHLKMIQKLIVWSKDDVLSEYTSFVEKVYSEQPAKITDRDICFAKSVLAFRKQRKYKNKNLSAEKIALLYKAGFK